MANIRHYPTSCLSMYCGESPCPDDCTFKPALDEFNKWVKETKAVCKDPDWFPTIYEATISPNAQ